MNAPDHSLFRWQPEMFDALIDEAASDEALKSIPQMPAYMDDDRSLRLRQFITGMMEAMRMVAHVHDFRTAAKLAFGNGFYLGWCAREKIMGQDELDRMMAIADSRLAIDDSKAWHPAERDGPISDATGFPK